MLRASRTTYQPSIRSRTPPSRRNDPGEGPGRVSRAGFSVVDIVVEVDVIVIVDVVVVVRRRDDGRGNGAGGRRLAWCRLAWR